MTIIFQFFRFFKKAFPDVPHTSWVFLSKILIKSCNISKIWRTVFDYLPIIQIWSFTLKLMILQIRFKFESRPNNQKWCTRFYLYCNLISKFYLGTLRGCGGHQEMPFIKSWKIENFGQFRPEKFGDLKLFFSPDLPMPYTSIIHYWCNFHHVNTLG